MTRTLTATAVLFFALTGLAEAQVYKWVDANGKVHYSQTKPRATNTARSEEISRTMRSGDTSDKKYAKELKKERPVREIIGEEMQSTNESLKELNKKYQENYNNLSDSRRAIRTEKDQKKKQEMQSKIAEMEQKQRVLEKERIHKLRRLEALSRIRKKIGKDEQTDRLARRELDMLLAR